MKIDWTIKQRLYALSLTCVAFIIAVAVTGYIAVRDLSHAKDEIALNGSALKNQLRADMAHDALRGDVLAAQVFESFSSFFSRHAQILSSPVTPLQNFSNSALQGFQSNSAAATGLASASHAAAAMYVLIARFDINIVPPRGGGKKAASAIRRTRVERGTRPGCHCSGRCRLSKNGSRTATLKAVCGSNRFALDLNQKARGTGSREAAGRRASEV